MIDEEKIRVTLELSELKTKHEGLTKFIESKRFDKLNAAEQLLLKKQSSFMKKYINILEARLSIWRTID